MRVLLVVLCLFVLSGCETPTAYKGSYDGTYRVLSVHQGVAIKVLVEKADNTKRRWEVDWPVTEPTVPRPGELWRVEFRREYRQDFGKYRLVQKESP